jgi:hypothetical protein
VQSNEEIQGNLAPFSRESNSESCTMDENARSAFQEGRKWMKKMTVKKIDKLMETRFQM